MLRSHIKLVRKIHPVPKRGVASERGVEATPQNEIASERGLQQ